MFKVLNCCWYLMSVPTVLTVLVVLAVVYLNHNVYVVKTDDVSAFDSRHMS